MATGFQNNLRRQEQLGRFAKELVRRSRSRCELCEQSNARLEIYEVPPRGEEPDFDACLFVCEMCLNQIEHPERMDPDHWRCLNRSLWSEVPAIQALSFRLLLRLAPDHPWAQDLLEEAWLDPEVEAWARSEK